LRYGDRKWHCQTLLFYTRSDYVCPLQDVAVSERDLHDTSWPAKRRLVDSFAPMHPFCRVETVTTQILWSPSSSPMESAQTPVPALPQKLVMLLPVTTARRSCTRSRAGAQKGCREGDLASSSRGLAGTSPEIVGWEKGARTCLHVRPGAQLYSSVASTKQRTTQ
jgi:hypothetical protein